ncbi:MAG: T9SS type A sorting domain-containing protein [Flavobacteriales bacterium]|nr:T9SS type A sorting domain-containing protein [Flavobacteriales bacterium]
MNLRSLLLGPALILGLVAFAQPTPPYPVTVSGYVNGCSPGNAVVTITTVQNTLPAINMTVQLDSNCNYFAMFEMDSPVGWFQVTSPCNGAMQTGTGNYSVNTFDTLSVVIDLNCGGAIVDCLGVPNGPALPGTACTTFLGIPGTWSASCTCVANTTNCAACFTTTQASSPAQGDIPFMAQFTNCSSGGVAPYTYAWSLDGGLTFEATTADLTTEFTAGIYSVCLLMSSSDGCTSMTCDSLVVDNNGIINPGSGMFDCLQIPNGPNVPGTPCSLPGSNELGMWNAACICVPDSATTTCEAGFFVMQAYQWVDSASNPNGGGGEPIPNELWLWNLSGGGTGNFQFLWTWGDGSSSTTAFPSHTYAGSGTYTICLTINDNAGCTSTYCQDITVDGDGILGGFVGAGNRATVTINVMNPLSVGVTELPTLSGLNAWPNPVNDVLNIALESRMKGNLRITITDLSGRVVANDTRSINDGRNNMSVSVAELNAGLYMITISNGTATLSERFVKVR